MFSLSRELLFSTFDQGQFLWREVFPAVKIEVKDQPRLRVVQLQLGDKGLPHLQIIGLVTGGSE